MDENNPTESKKKWSPTTQWIMGIIAAIIVSLFGAIAIPKIVDWVNVSKTALRNMQLVRSQEKCPVLKEIASL